MDRAPHGHRQKPRHCRAHDRWASGRARALDAADQLRLEQMLQENAWASFHIWERTQRGIFPKGTFEATGGALLNSLLRTPGGGTWWRSNKHIGFPPGFVADVDAILKEA